MIKIPDDVLAKLPPRWGVEILNRCFDQRPTEQRPAPWPRLFSVGYISGAQAATSELESEFLEQAARTCSIYDLITHATFGYEIDGRRSVAEIDVVMQLFPSNGGQPERYLVDVREEGSPPPDAAEAERLAAARALAAGFGAVCRTLSADEIRTPFLATARAMSRWRHRASNRTTGVVFDFLSAKGLATLSDTIAHVEAAGLGRARARDGVMEMVSRRYVHANLFDWAGDDTPLRMRSEEDMDHALEPLLKVLMEAPSF